MAHYSRFISKEMPPPAFMEPDNPPVQYLPSAQRTHPLLRRLNLPRKIIFATYGAILITVSAAIFLIRRLLFPNTTEDAEKALYITSAVILLIVFGVSQLIAWGDRIERLRKICTLEKRVERALGMEWNYGFKANWKELEDEVEDLSWTACSFC